MINTFFLFQRDSPTPDTSPRTEDDAEKNETSNGTNPDSSGLKVTVGLAQSEDEDDDDDDDNDPGRLVSNF